MQVREAVMLFLCLHVLVVLFLSAALGQIEQMKLKRNLVFKTLLFSVLLTHKQVFTESDEVE